MPKERGNLPVYHYGNHTYCDINWKSDCVTGDGLFSGISSIVSPAVKFFSNNKDLIVNTAKSAGAIGSAASTISRVVEADKQLKQIDAIRKLRELELNKKNSQKKISDSALSKINNLATDSQVPQGDGLLKF